MKYARLLFIGSLLTLLIGCGSTGTDTVKVALVCPLTGDDAAHGQGMKRGFHHGDRGCQRRRKNSARSTIEALPFDDRSDPKEAVTVANQVISDRGIIGIVGHLNSGCSIPASQVYAKRNLVHDHTSVHEPETDPAGPKERVPRLRDRRCSGEFWRQLRFRYTRLHQSRGHS